MKVRNLIGAALATGLATMACSAAPMKPGLWEVMTRGETAAASAAPSPMSRVCFTDQDIAKTAKTLPVPSASCQSLNPVTGKDGKTSYDIACTGTPAMRGRGTIAMTPAAYEGSMQLSIKIAPDKPDAAMNFTFAGRRVGDCPGASK